LRAIKTVSDFSCKSNVLFCSNMTLSATTDKICEWANRFLRLDCSCLVHSINSVLFILALFPHFGVSRVFCRDHLLLLAPWATRLLSQWMLCWWRIIGSTAPWLFPCTHTLTPITRLDRLQVPFLSLWYNLAGNRTQPTSLGGECSTNYTILLCFLFFETWIISFIEKYSFVTSKQRETFLLFVWRSWLQLPALFHDFKGMWCNSCYHG